MLSSSLQSFLMTVSSSASSSSVKMPPKKKADNDSPSTSSNNNHRNHKNKNKNKKNHRHQQQPSLKTISHSLSWALRHHALELHLPMTPDGFVPLDMLLKSHPKFQNVTPEQVHQVVQDNDKQRFKLQEKSLSIYDSTVTDPTLQVLCIRANQGHSISIIDPNLLLRKLSPTELQALPCIVHGTYHEPWKLIAKNGLSKMNRTHIHFATGLASEGHVISGMRTSCQVYIYIDAAKCCAQDDDDDSSKRRIEFYQSDNGVVLTAGIDGVLPIEYFSHVVDSSGKIFLDQRAG